MNNDSPTQIEFGTGGITVHGAQELTSLHRVPPHNENKQDLYITAVIKSLRGMYVLKVLSRNSLLFESSPKIP